MKKGATFLLMSLLALSALSAQGCGSLFGSTSGDERGARAERIDEPAIKHVPSPEYGLSTSQTRPSLRAELSARNATGLPSGALIDVLFDFDRASLRPDALVVLEGNAKRLQRNGVARVLLEGRGDEIGTAAYNIVLGDRRARNVRLYLEDLGLAVELTTASYGKDRPLCFQHNEDCMQRNRSVHFVVRE